MNVMKKIILTTLACGLFVAGALAQTVTTTVTTQTVTTANGDTTVVTRTETTTTSSSPSAQSSIAALLQAAAAQSRNAGGQITVAVDSLATTGKAAIQTALGVDANTAADILSLLNAVGDSVASACKGAASKGAAITLNYAAQAKQKVGEAVRLTPAQADSIRAAVDVARAKVDDLLKYLTEPAEQTR